MVEFVDMTRLEVHLVYYSPYHSKYNAIERYWAGLEKSWNEYLLDSVSCVLNRAGNFIWKGLRSTVKLLDAVYKKGGKVCGAERIKLEERIQRSKQLPLYDFTISPIRVN